MERCRGKFLTPAAVYHGWWCAVTDNDCNDEVLNRRCYIMQAQMVQINIKLLSFLPNTKMQQIGLFEKYPIACVE